MKLLIPGGGFSTSESRKAFATLLADIMHAGQSTSFAPYITSGCNDMCWTVDHANNWKVQFFDTQVSVVEVEYRYQCAASKAEEALVGWLVHRYGATVIE